MTKITVLTLLALALAAGSMDASAKLVKETDAAGTVTYSYTPQGDQDTSAFGRMRENYKLNPGEKICRSARSANLSDSMKAKIRYAALAYSVPVELLQAVAAVESDFKHNARSPKGALGIMQLMPGTAKMYASDASNTELLRELHISDKNLMYGAKHLSYLSRKYQHREDLLLAAYNAGEGAVRNAGNAVPGYPETQNYVRSVGAEIRCIRKNEYQ